MPAQNPDMLGNVPDKALAALVSPKPFAAVVFDLIGVAEREGWTSELVQAARDHIPGNPELKRPVAREAIMETHGANVAEVPWHGCRQYGNNAEALPERQCRQHAALRDAKNRSARLLSQRMEAGIAEAGDDKSRRVLLKGCRKSAKGINDTVHMVLRLDAWWSFFKGQAFDRRRRCANPTHPKSASICGSGTSAANA